jgi:hypothetical protein
MSVVSAVSEYNVISITHDIDWAGIKWEDDEVSVQWCWSKFIAKSKAEKLTAPPALLRKDITWTPYLRELNNSLWITLKEGQTWGPEDGEPAPMILFGPEATIKMRSTAPNPIDQLMACLYTMYQGRYDIHERVATREWALVATIGDQTKVGQVPIQYRLPDRQVNPPEVRAFHQRILEASLITQNYDRGMDKFVRKFVPEECMTATVAIQEGRQGDHGWAIHLKQGERRALLMDTLEGLTNEEVFWTALACWAIFQPRKVGGRIFAGKLFYPDEASHIIHLCWNDLNDLSRHPNFKNESAICQERMKIFSQAMRKFKRTPNWRPQPCAEAPDEGLRIAQIAAFSRIRPFADGPNQWDLHRSSAATDATSQGGMAGTESSPGLGSPDMRAARSSPSLT